MCPVYMRNGSYTAKSEIFSLGIVLAEMLTGRLQGLQKMDLSIPRVLRGTPADARAGEWPDDAVQQLKALAGRCTAHDIEERPAEMATVVRELRALLERHCPASAGEAGDAMIAELAAARAQLDRMRLDQQFQDMQRARAAAPQLQCCVCMEDVAASDGCTCSGAAPGHFFCNECFCDMVASQVTGEGKPVFLAAGCEVTCSVCQVDGVRCVFDMRLCAPHLTPAAYSAYLKTMAEPEVVREQREWQQRMQEQQADFAARLQNMTIEELRSVQSVSKLDPHLQHIAEQLILPRCPSCRRLIPDIEAATVLQVPIVAPTCQLTCTPPPLLLLNPVVAVRPPFFWRKLRARAGLRCPPLRLVPARVPRCRRLPRPRSLLPSQPQPRQRVPSAAAPANVESSDEQNCPPARASVSERVCALDA